MQFGEIWCMCGSIKNFFPEGGGGDLRYLSFSGGVPSTFLVIVNTSPPHPSNHYNKKAYIFELSLTFFLMSIFKELKNW